MAFAVTRFARRPRSNAAASRNALSGFGQFTAHLHEAVVHAGVAAKLERRVGLGELLRQGGAVVEQRVELGACHQQRRQAHQVGMQGRDARIVGMAAAAGNVVPAIPGHLGTRQAEAAVAAATVRGRAVVGAVDTVKQQRRVGQCFAGVAQLDRS